MKEKRKSVLSAFKDIKRRTNCIYILFMSKKIDEKSAEICDFALYDRNGATGASFVLSDPGYVGNYG